MTTTQEMIEARTRWHAVRDVNRPGSDPQWDAIKAYHLIARSYLGERGWTREDYGMGWSHPTTPVRHIEDAVDIAIASQRYFVIHRFDWSSASIVSRAMNSDEADQYMARLREDPSLVHCKRIEAEEIKEKPYDQT